MKNREEKLQGKRDRAKAKRDADPEAYNTKKMDRYYNEPGYKERVIRKIRQKRLSQPEYYLWSKAKRRASKSGMEFTIELADIVIPKLCPVLGIPIGVLKGASLDRIDNGFGYIKGNVMVISRRANTIKSDASLHELVMMGKFYGAYLERDD